ncbi:hypothetical protein GZH47_09460 [Paenibacillus rhizovicinus]|uniref:Uncharacterized protein n=1 Tax=Paenibacillus rhizovicinus TaxID=2704463 RepID=A0A6C0P8Y7_9BACL|nr:hypothetical protein GZH47_09460 [Paenibacillus rhizovicinus]
MKREEERAESLRSKLFTKDGKPLRILSTSLGLALLANAAFGTIAHAEGETGTEQPKLVEWSSDEVKQYFDPAVDWNIPMLDEEDNGAAGAVEPNSNAGTGSTAGTGTSGSSGDTIIINNGSTSIFGWDDLMLYHLLFNQGSSYSTTRWYSSHTTYNGTTHQPYKAKTYTSDSFQNKPVVGSTVRPKTTSNSGTITRRSKSTSSSPGGIGGNSSTLSTKNGSSSSSSGSSSSSSSRSSSSHSSGGFGG